MKKIFFAGSLLLAFVAAVAFKPVANDPESLAIGASAPMTTVKMKSTVGKDLALADIKRGNGLLVVFSCNTCPFVVGAEGYGDGWEGRYPELQKFAMANNVGMVLVNSNEGKRDKGDNLNDMKARSKEKGLEAIAYCLDENSALANAFGARTTPHVFLFDKDFKLVYKGSIDDNNESPSLVKEHYVKNAITSLANGQKVSVAETKPLGCSIKRVQK